MSNNSIAPRRARGVKPALAFWAALACIGLAAGVARAAVIDPRTYLVSAGPPGVPPDPLLTHANLTSEYAQSSYDGMRAVFTSDATNLDPAMLPAPVGDDPVGSWDIFLRVMDAGDPAQGSSYLVSATRSSVNGYNGTDPTLVAAGAVQAQSSWATISRDGKWIAYQSDSDEIIASGLPFVGIYLVNADDVVSRSTNPRRYAISTESADGPSGNPTFDPISRTFSNPYPPAAIYLKTNNDPCVVYQSDATNLDSIFADTNNKSDLFVWCYDTNPSFRVNRLLTRTTGGAAINGAAWGPSVSADGRYVAFVSNAINLISGVNGEQVYLMDRDPDGDGDLGNTNPAYSLVSRAPGGGMGNAKSWYPSISASGNFVAFATEASNLETQKLNFDGVTPVVDSNGVTDVYLYHHRTRQTELVSLRMSSTAETSGGGLVFNLPRLLQAASVTPTISADGRYVAFKSFDNFVTYLKDFNMDQDRVAPDIFRYDRLNPGAQMIKISLADQGAMTQYWQTSFPAMSGNKRFVFFTTDDNCFPAGSDVPGACELLPYYRNIFVRDLGPQGGEAALGVSTGGVSGVSVFPGSAIAANGKTVTYTLKNWGTANLTVDSVTLSPGAAGLGYTLDNHTCSGADADLSPAVGGAAPSDSCSFSITYTRQGSVGVTPFASVVIDWSYDGGAGMQARSDEIVLVGKLINLYLPAVLR